MTDQKSATINERAVREKILAVAAKGFEDSGYHTTSMAAIALAVGLSKATLYHYFDSKGAILFSIHDQYLDEVIEKITDRRDAGLPPEDLIRGFVHDVLELSATGGPGRIRVFFEYENELPNQLTKQLRAKRAQYFDAVRMMIYEGVERGEFISNDVSLDAYALFGMCNWAYRWFQPGGRRTAAEVADHFSDLFLSGLRAGNRPHLLGAPDPQ